MSDSSGLVASSRAASPTTTSGPAQRTCYRDDGEQKREGQPAERMQKWHEAHREEAAYIAGDRHSSSAEAIDHRSSQNFRQYEGEHLGERDEACLGGRPSGGQDKPGDRGC